MIKNPTHLGVVHPWHCDHMGHMNVMYYVNKFDEASWNFFSMIGLDARRMTREKIGLAAVQQNISYARELMPGETIYVNTKPLEIRGKVLRFVHEMLNGETDELCASCELTVVHMDTNARKATPFPDDVKEVLEKAIASVGSNDNNV